MTKISSIKNRTYKIQCHNLDEEIEISLFYGQKL